MRRISVAMLAFAACERGTSGAVPDLGVETIQDMQPPEPAPDLAPDSPPPVDCEECVRGCLEERCPSQYAACLVNQCPPPDGGTADAAAGDGGPAPDASGPLNCQQLAFCLILTQCNPLEGPGTPCFDACYDPACVTAKAAFDDLLACGVDMCADDCLGCMW